MRVGAHDYASHSVHDGRMVVDGERLLLLGQFYPPMRGDLADVDLLWLLVFAGATPFFVVAHGGVHCGCGARGAHRAGPEKGPENKCHTVCVVGFGKNLRGFGSWRWTSLRRRSTLGATEVAHALSLLPTVCDPRTQTGGKLARGSAPVCELGVSGGIRGSSRAACQYARVRGAVGGGYQSTIVSKHLWTAGTRLLTRLCNARK